MAAEILGANNYKALVLWHAELVWKETLRIQATIYRRNAACIYIERMDYLMTKLMPVEMDNITMYRLIYVVS
jgi:hypothetical protein